MKKKLIFIKYALQFLFLFYLSINTFSQESNFRISYFINKSNNVTLDYSFLEKTLPISFKAIMERNNYTTVNTGETKITDIYNLFEIIEIGKRLNTEIIIAGSYSIKGEGINAKIKLTLLVYDIAGGEKIIQKLIVGATGTGMFVMIDEATDLLKIELIQYFKQRNEILKIAKQERERLEALTEAERQKELEKQLLASEIRTKLNSSQYLSTHTASAGQLKFFVWGKFASQDKKTVLTDTNSAISNIGQTSTQLQLYYIYSNLSLSIGLGKNLEAGIEFAFYLTRWFNFNIYNYSTNFVEPDKVFTSAMFNPNYFFKWRFLQDENHNLNLTAYIGIQPSLGEKIFGNSIFHPLTMTNIDAFHIGLFSSKTIGKFTPFIDLKFTINILSTGLFRASSSTGNAYIDDFEKKSDKVIFHFMLKVGTECRINSWLILQPSYSFGYSSNVKYFSNTTTPGSINLVEGDKWIQHDFNLTTIFVISNKFSIAGQFNYSIIKDTNGKYYKYQNGVYDGTYTFYNTKFKNVFSVFLYLTGLIDLF